MGTIEGDRAKRENGEKMAWTTSREAAAIRLGTVTRVLADRSESSVEGIADLAAGRAGEMELR